MIETTVQKKKTMINLNREFKMPNIHKTPQSLLKIMVLHIKNQIIDNKMLKK
jgi:hypothetical protein